MNKPLVMVIDDYAPDRVFARIVLDKAECFGGVMEVPGGEEALELFEKYLRDERDDLPEGFPPLLVLLDINMPRMTGFEFLDRFTELAPKLGDDAPAVLMLTSSEQPYDQERAETYEVVVGYIAKPLTQQKALALCPRPSSS